MWQLRAILNSLIGESLEVTTEYSKVTGTLVEVNYDYIELGSNSNILIIPFTGIESVAY